MLSTCPVAGFALDRRVGVLAMERGHVIMALGAGRAPHMARGMLPLIVHRGSAVVPVLAKRLWYQEMPGCKRRRDGGDNNNKYGNRVAVIGPDHFRVPVVVV